MAKKNSGLQRDYVSELDKFLATFDEKHADKTASQQVEIDKHAKLFKRRDEPQPNVSQDLFD